MSSALTLAPAAVDTLNTLPRSELAACEAYRLVIRRIQRNAESSPLGLRTILRSHEKHVAELHPEVARLGGEPAASSGVWGFWAATRERLAVLLGDRAALSALAEGERHSIALARAGAEEVEGPAGDVIREDVLPSLLAHVDLLGVLAENAA